jgi:GNAT superfamily N-acetyltransferase
MQIEKLREGHWEDAAGLVAAAVRRLRQEVTVLPPQYTEAAAVLPLLAELAGRVPGVAAVERGQLVGFLCAMSLGSFKGKRGAFSPAWANGAMAEDARRIYQAMYAALAPDWLLSGCVVHTVQLLAHDAAGREGLYWLGFGLNNVDAIRDLAPVDPGNPGSPGARAGEAQQQELTIRRATVADVDVVAELGEGLQRHLADSPVYLPYLHREAAADHAAWLAQADNRQWLAFRGGQPVAELRCEPANYTALAMAADPGTVFITSAYTVPAERNTGVAGALLGTLLAEVRAAGYVRCATDFESANLPGARFWLHHFQPTAYAVVRYVDERAEYAHGGRRRETFW